MIIDTDILIWFFRGHEGAKDFIANILYKKRMISTLCVMELIQGCKDKREMKTVRDFLHANFSEVLPLDDKVSEKAIGLLERYALSDGLRTVDALIAASALTRKAELATANYKHYKNIDGLQLIRFEP